VEVCWLTFVEQHSINMVGGCFLCAFRRGGTREEQKEAQNIWTNGPGAPHRKPRRTH
jgi:hypothetical protein